MANHDITEVWDVLRNVQALRFKSESYSGIGWQGEGTGVVKVSEPAPDVLLFEESGKWRQSSGKEIRFSNVYRWSIVENRLRLEHLRFGADHPVFLFEMEPDAEGTWRDISAHPCREDSYSAALLVQNGLILLKWTVSPKRKELIDYLYV